MCKYRRALETVGSLNQPNYIKILKNKYSNREIENYEIDKITNYENFDLNKIKNMFSNSRIHVYDLNLDGKYTNGNNTGRLAFKIRRNDNIDDFETKRNALFNKINSMGYNINSKILNTNKPPISSIPTNLNWASDNIEKYSFGKIIQKTNNPIIKKCYTERFKHSKDINTHYKSNFISHKNLNSKNN